LLAYQSHLGGSNARAGARRNRILSGLIVVQYCTNLPNLKAANLNEADTLKMGWGGLRPTIRGGAGQPLDRCADETSFSFLFRRKKFAEMLVFVGIVVSDFCSSCVIADWLEWSLSSLGRTLSS